MTSSNLIRAAGEALYGATSWQLQLARDLGVNRETVARWARGDFAIPPARLAELAALCEERAAGLAKLAKAIRRHP